MEEDANETKPIKATASVRVIAEQTATVAGSGAAAADKTKKLARGKSERTRAMLPSFAHFTLNTFAEEEKEVYTRPLPLTSCQEDRLGLDYTVLCYG